MASLTGGVGADGVIITASTPSSEVVSHRVQDDAPEGPSRARRATWVWISIAPTSTRRSSTSSYRRPTAQADTTRTYEEHGLDYPIGYVRWTENRNMQEYLRLVGDRPGRTSSLSVGATFTLEQAPAAYDAVRTGSPRPVMVLLEYPDGPRSRCPARHQPPRSGRSRRDAIGVAVVGAGGFAKGMHLPNIRDMSELSLEAIVSRTGPNAVDTARQFGARYSTTEFERGAVG